MKKIILIVISLIIPQGVFALEPPHGENSYTNECVVILHGMGRTKNSMNSVETALKSHGFMTVNSDYTTRGKDFEEILNGDVERAVRECMSKKPSKVHFVTHSLGGILVRQYLQDSTVTSMGGRVVMLAPPNGGSKLSDIATKYVPLYDWFLGPVGAMLGKNGDSLPLNIKPLEGIEVGIIAGNGTLNPLYSLLVSGDDDGKVSIESAKLEEMKDFIVVRSSHSFIMRRKAVKNQIAYFLKNGYFERELEGEPLSYKEDSNKSCEFLKDGSIEDYDEAGMCKCCRAFDEAYFKGGTLADKEKADKDFRQCTIDVTGCIATVERVFGDLKSTTPNAFKDEDYRWGYGWAGNRLLNPLYDKEHIKVTGKLKDVSLGQCVQY